MGGPHRGSIQCSPIGFLLPQPPAVRSKRPHAPWHGPRSAHGSGAQAPGWLLPRSPPPPPTRGQQQRATQQTTRVSDTRSHTAPRRRHTQSLKRLGYALRRGGVLYGAPTPGYQLCTAKRHAPWPCTCPAHAAAGSLSPATPPGRPPWRHGLRGGANVMTCHSKAGLTERLQRAWR